MTTNYPAGVADSDFFDGGWAAEPEINEEYYSLEYYTRMERVANAKSLQSAIHHLRDASDIISQAELAGYDEISKDDLHNGPMTLNAVDNLLTLLRSEKT